MKTTYTYTTTSLPVNAKETMKKIEKKTGQRKGEIWVEALTDYAKKKKVRL